MRDFDFLISHIPNEAKSIENATKTIPTGAYIPANPALGVGIMFSIPKTKKNIENGKTSNSPTVFQIVPAIQSVYQGTRSSELFLDHFIAQSHQTVNCFVHGHKLKSVIEIDRMHHGNALAYNHRFYVNDNFINKPLFQKRR